ncbi:pituitary tumor-transforming gene 1 protein-interacting protein-like [Arapaima gigas]
MYFLAESRLDVSLVLFIFVGCSIISQGNCVTTTSVPPPQKQCNTFSSCETCLQNVSCLWCNTNSTCLDYPVRHLLPPSSMCQLSQARWGVCWVNFEALIIAMAVVGGTILLSIVVCCCCCCCKRRKSGLDREEERYAQRREEIRKRSETRKAERKARHDEIRKKYGLIPDADHPYSKFEND